MRVHVAKAATRRRASASGVAQPSVGMQSTHNPNNIWASAARRADVRGFDAIRKVDGVLGREADVQVGVMRLHCRRLTLDDDDEDEEDDDEDDGAGAGAAAACGQARDGVESLVDVVARYGRWCPGADLVVIQDQRFAR